MTCTSSSMYSTVKGSIVGGGDYVILFMHVGMFLSNDNLTSTVTKTYKLRIYRMF